MRDDYNIEEKDDERTFNNELTPDCENRILPVIEYLGEFKALIDACGQVSYHFNMKKFVSADINKAKKIASAYHHDAQYYTQQLNEWRVKARRSYAIVGFHAARLGFQMPNENDFLNSLVISKDRRAAYKGYLDTCLKKEEPLSPCELETKFQCRLKKRLNKA